MRCVLAAVVVVIIARALPAGEQPGLPKTFTAVDTSRLLGTPDPLPLEAERVFEKLQFERPVELTFAPDGSKRLFVLEQKGVIRVFENDADVAEAEVFLDLSDVVLSEGNEEGMLGLAFHPKYAENGKFYVCYSAKPRSSVIASYRVSKDDPKRAVRDSEERLLVIPQPYPNHNGGSIRFGLDGYLYIGMGDGGLRDDPHDNAQNLGSLLGKVLRIDVDKRDEGLAYAVPKDNPFVDRPSTPGLPEPRGEVWAYGFRNIWRLGFDRKTGELWAGDVGQDRFEEVDLVHRGGNYGWNLREGMHDFLPNTPGKDDRFIEPAAEYFHGEGQSVTGGFVYRHDRPANFRGHYFFADYLSGKVWTIGRTEDGGFAPKREAANTGLQIAAFGEDADGEMYLCAFDGHIHRLRERDAEVAAEAKKFPRTLSETGLFRSVERNELAEGLVPYELNVPFWSDYAVKDRYLALPEAASVEFREDQAWKFPVGTVLVKTFWMHQDHGAAAKPRRLETRLLVHGREGWAGYTYVYDDDQREAHLINEGRTVSLEIEHGEGKESQTYYFPSRADCMACHTKQHGFVLGMETPQLNRVQNYHGDQENVIGMFGRLGVFKESPKKPLDDLQRFPDWGFGNFDRSGPANGAAVAEKPREPEGDTETLARAWLDVNCSMCHRPDGIAPMKRDLQFDTPLEKMNLLNQPIGQRRRRPPDVRLIAPGEPERSELLTRISTRGPYQMPPLATHYIDPRGYEILRRWIAAMPKEKAVGGATAEPPR
jgi:uncharacterized repeat protein (TIGR03806 family)